MNNVYKCKKSPNAIHRDLPLEIIDGRKRLWKSYKDAPKAPQTCASIVYPAKLIVNGQVVADEFPQWNDIVHMKRNLSFEHIRPRNNVVVNNFPVHDTYSDSSQSVRTSENILTSDPSTIQSLHTTHAHTYADAVTTSNAHVLGPLPSSQTAVHPKAVKPVNLSATQNVSGNGPVIASTSNPDTLSRNVNPHVRPFTQQSIYVSNAPVNTPGRTNTSSVATGNARESRQTSKTNNTLRSTNRSTSRHQRDFRANRDSTSDTQSTSESSQTPQGRVSS